MPFTFNGIGTHYYGAGNRSSVTDVCEFCNRNSTLSSYDTREWFCILFIPIIPLTKYRILADCASCRKHNRISWKRFSEVVESNVQPLRDEVERSPRDPGARIRLILALANLEMHAEANRESATALELFPNDADLNLLAAQLTSDAGRLAEALPFYRKASQLDPSADDAAYGLGWTLNQLGQHSEAIEPLRRAAEHPERKPTALYLLGNSQMELHRWSEALQSLQSAISARPEWSADKELVRKIVTCKKKLGHPLSESERKVSGFSWLGSKKSKKPPAAVYGAGIRPSLKIAGVACLLVILAAGAFYVWDAKTNIRVYLDNSLPVPVLVDADGQTFHLAPDRHQIATLKEGEHVFRVTSESGDELETLEVNLEESGLLDAVLEKRFFVYNIGQLHVYRRAIYGYATDQSNASYDEKLIGPARFIEQTSVDYEFQEPPETISMSSSTSRVVKTGFDVAREIDPLSWAMYRLNEGAGAEAEEVLRRVATVRTCDDGARRLLAMVVRINDSPAAGISEARKWMQECPESSLQAHRALQDIAIDSGEDRQLLTSYRDAAAASPDSAEAHYLYGRIADDDGVAEREYRTAIRLDSSLVWPHVALGYRLSDNGRHEEALKQIETALELPDHDPTLTYVYATRAIAADDPELAIPLVDEIRSRQPDDDVAFESRWLLALASADWTTAEKLAHERSKLEPPQASWWRKVRQHRLQGHPNVASEIEGGRRSPDLEAPAALFGVEMLLQDGEYLRAAEAIHSAGDLLDDLEAVRLNAFAAAGLILEGKQDEANTALEHARTRLASLDGAPGTRLEGMILDTLQGSASPQPMLKLARMTDTTRHAWTVAAVRAALDGDSKRARDCFANARRASSDLDFPWLELAALEETASSNL